MANDALKEILLGPDFNPSSPRPAPPWWLSANKLYTPEKKPAEAILMDLFGIAPNEPTNNEVSPDVPNRPVESVASPQAQIPYSPSGLDRTAKLAAISGLFSPKRPVYTPPDYSGEAFLADRLAEDLQSSGGPQAPATKASTLFEKPIDAERYAAMASAESGSLQERAKAFTKTMTEDATLKNAQQQLDAAILQLRLDAEKTKAELGLKGEEGERKELIGGLNTIRYALQQPGFTREDKLKLANWILSALGMSSREELAKILRINQNFEVPVTEE